MERHRLHVGMQRPDPLAKEGVMKQQLQELLDSIYAQVHLMLDVFMCVLAVLTGAITSCGAK